MNKKVSLLVAMILVLSLVFTGCGGNETPTGGETDEVRDTMKIGHHGDVPSLDTHNALNDNAMRVMTNIYDPLIRMNENYEIIPGVAERWEVSEDGKEYTFYIKEGIKFHNGDDLKISDVVFSVERGMASPQASPSFSRVVGVEAVGDNAVKIKLNAPYNQILTSLALPVAGIVSEKVVTEAGDDFGRNPVGTGPYKLKDWVSGEKVVIEAFEDYHQEPASIKTVEFITISDKSAATISLEKGDIDAYVDANINDFSRIEENENLTLYKGEAFAYYFIGINVTNAPFDNVKVRQAVAHAVDKESMLYGVQGGFGEIIDTFATDKFAGFTDDIQKYPYDIEKAKQILADAGYPDGFETNIYVSNETMAKYAQVLQSSLLKIGITANIVTLERSAYQVACEGGEADIFINGNTFAAPTVDEAVYDAVHSEYIGKSNYFFYKNDRLDELFDESRMTIDETKIAKLYEEVLIILSEDVPAIPITWRYVNIAANKDLKNVYTNPYSFYYIYDFSW